MSEGPDLESVREPAPFLRATAADDEADPRATDGVLPRTLLFVGVAAFSAGLAFAIVRATLLRSPADPTTERIQHLIDEANRLLAQLDDKKSDA